MPYHALSCLIMPVKSTWKLSDEGHYTWGTRPRRLADKRSIHRNRSRLRQQGKRVIQEIRDDSQI